MSSGPRVPNRPDSCPQTSLDTGLPSSLPSGARLTLRPKTCTDCRGPLDGMAADVEKRSSPRGAATGKGKRGATLAAFQGLRRRVVLSVATGENFTACGRDFGLAAGRWVRGAEGAGPGNGRDWPEPGRGPARKGQLYSHVVVSDSLGPSGLQPARLPCLSLSPGVCLNSCSSRR